MKRQFIIHPFLFALFPILFVYSRNIGQILGSEIYLPLAIVLILTSVIWFSLRLLFRESGKAAAVTSVFWTLFFSYGHVDALLNADSYLFSKAVVVWQGWLLLLLWGMLFLLAILLAMRYKGDLSRITGILTVAGIFIVALQAVMILFNAVNFWYFGLNVIGEESREYYIDARHHFVKPAELPNIYYIILDGYAREDTLREFYNYDNTDLLQYLTRNGFYIAGKSRSNYDQTTLSLASSLNGEYLDTLGVVNPDSQDRILMFKLLEQSRVIRLLKKLGYKIVTFSSGYKLVYIQNADIHITSRFGMPEFQDSLLQTTPIPFLVQHLPFLNFSDIELHRRRINFIFDYLDNVLTIRAPIFVFVHILCPHPPFVFDRNGRSVNPPQRYMILDGPQLMKEEGLTREDYVRAYREQLMYINTRIKKTLDEILSRARGEPIVIIVQGDHGPGSMLDWDDVNKTNLKERFGILNVYYFDDGKYGQLYQTISPVNTFKAIFNHYFGAGYELLPDKSYFSSWDYPYKFIDVSAKVR